MLANEQVLADGTCERCGAEVTKRELTQWYFQHDGVRPGAATTAWTTCRPPGSARSSTPSATGSAAPRARTSLRRRGPRRAADGLHHAPRHAVRRDVHGRGRRRAAGRRAGRRRAAPGAGGLPRRGAQGLRHRPAGHRPAQDRRRPGRHRDQPGHRRADPGVGLRLRAGRLRHRRDHGRAGPRPARPGLRQRDRPAGAHGRRHRRRRPGGERRRDDRRRHLRQLRPAGRAERQAEGVRRDHRAAGGRRPRRRHGQLPAARLAAVAPALLGRADPDHPLPGRRRGRRARGPAARRAARAARRRPEAQGHLAAGRGDRVGRGQLPDLRRTGAARHRHDGHLRRLVVVLPALPVPARRHPGLRPRAGQGLGPDRPLHRRRRARRAAPAVRAVLHQGAARHGPDRLGRAVLGVPVARARSSTTAAR